MTASPVLLPYPEIGVIGMETEDGAYYVARDEIAQVIIVGAMHFTPGDYFRALNELLDTHYDLYSSEFMLPGDKVLKKKVLDRGFVSLIGRRNH